MQRVPFSRPVVTKEMVDAMATAISSERMVMGESVFKFEDEFAQFIGTDHAVSVASGTAALHLSLIAVQVCGMEVLTTPFSFIATANVVVQASGTPKFADINETDYNLDPAKARKAVGERTRAIMPVHLFGQPADLDPLMETAGGVGAVLVEDAAQAHGAKYKGKNVGSIGDIGCFSFYPTKNMTVGGDGGMVTTNDEKLAKNIAKLRDCGRVSRYLHDVVGFTSRLNTVNAAFGRVQLKMLAEWNERRRAIAKIYSTQLLDLNRVALPPAPSKEVVPVFHVYVISCGEREALMKHLNEKGVEALVHYPVPIHRQPIYQQMYGAEEGSFPIAERMANRVVSLPIFPSMKDEEVMYVCEAIRSYYER